MVSEYRCETCNKWDTPKGEFGIKCPLYPYRRNIDRANLIVHDLSIIKYTGCTFHSSFKSERDVVEGVYDDLGVLYGDAAERFNEYLNAPREEPSEEARAIILAAQQIAEEMSDKGVRRNERKQTLNDVERRLRQSLDSCDNAGQEEGLGFAMQIVSELRGDTNPADPDKKESYIRPPRNGCEGCRHFISSTSMECTYRDRDMDFEYIDKVAERGCENRKPI